MDVIFKGDEGINRNFEDFSHCNLLKHNVKKAKESLLYEEKHNSLRL